MLSGLARDDLTSILVQPRRTGLSDPGSRVATAEERAADLLAIMAAERVERATIGALAAVALPAMLLAAQLPERVRALSLYGAPLTGPLIDAGSNGWTPYNLRVVGMAERCSVIEGDLDLVVLPEREPADIRLGVPSFAAPRDGRSSISRDFKPIHIIWS